MIKNIVIATSVLVIGGLLFVDFAPKATVVPEIQKTSTIKHPVREGNCWRQFTATDSILVCH